MTQMYLVSVSDSPRDIITKSTKHLQPPPSTSFFKLKVHKTREAYIRVNACVRTITICRKAMDQDFFCCGTCDCSDPHSTARILWRLLRRNRVLCVPSQYDHA